MQYYDILSRGDMSKLEYRIFIFRICIPFVFNFDVTTEFEIHLVKLGTK